MPKIRTPIYSFNVGEISRRMEGRSDLDGIHDRALAKMLNYVATVEGPATKRPGFRYVIAAAQSSTWLSRFVFNSTQSYVLEWCDQRLRFYTNGGQIEDPVTPGAPYEVVIPYAAADAPRISAKQSYDRQYLAHPSYPPQMLERTGAETFDCKPIPLSQGPFKDWNTDESKTITWAGDGSIGTEVTVSANFDLFKPGHVGAPFIFEVVGFDDIPAWEPAVKTRVNDPVSQVAVGALFRAENKVYECVDLGGSKFTGTIEPTHTKGAEWDGAKAAAMGQNDGYNGGVKWQYKYDRWGIGTIVSISSSYEATLKVTRAFPTLGATPTWHWAHAAFSTVEGYPQLVFTWGGRLMFIKGVEIAGSVVGDYFNFLPVNEDGEFSVDMAFRESLQITDPPAWVHADTEYLLLGTHSEEVVVGQINTAAGISANNLKAQPQSAYGSASTWPLAVGTAVLFLQRAGRKIREASFSYQQGRFVGLNANVYARHITRSGIKWLAMQTEPEELLWGGRGDGTLIAHPHNPEQDIKGFSRVELAAGTVVSGVAIPSDDGSVDDLWILAELPPVTQGIPTQRAILKLDPFWDEDAGLTMADAFFVDWGVSYAGAPKQDFTEGLEHLEGRQVRILADGVEINTLTVAGNAITLPKPASKVAIGLGYAGRLQLLRAEARGTPTLQGLRKRVQKLFTRLIDSAALVVFNRAGEGVRLFDRPNALPMDSAQPLYNGDTENVRVGGGGSDYSDAPELVSDNALPSTISLLVPTYEVEEFPQ